MARAMRDSGIEWIGEIPKDWEIVKYKHICQTQNGYPFDSDKFSLSDGFPLIRIRDITSGEIETFYNGEYDESYVVKSNDLLVGMDGDFNIRWWSNQDALLNQRCMRINPINGIVKRFLYYTLPFQLKIINDLTYATTVKHLSHYSVYDAKLAIPEIAEQQKIADFLDEKTVHIDSIISQTKESIEAFKAYKQALITESVTKGLNPEVQMKDSGVKWIGEIPEHWDISRIGKIYDVILGKMLSAEKKGDDWTFERYICAANVHFDGVDTSSLKSMWFSPRDKENLEVKWGDLLIVEGGAGAGGSSLYLSEETNIFIQNSINIVRSKSERGNTRYAYYLMHSLVKNGYIDFISSKATFAHFTKEKVQAVPYPVIPVSEQQQIVDFLDEKTAHIDSLIADKQKMVQELEIYKKSLIYEYVTGKKEV